MAEAAEYAHVSPRSIKRYVQEGYLPSYRIRSRTVRIDLDDVDTRLLRPNTGYEAP
jgi:excisionase family DNA binding protein